MKSQINGLNAAPGSLLAMSNDALLDTVRTLDQNNAALTVEVEEYRAKEKWARDQEASDNTIQRPRMTRNQMRAMTLRDNPGMKLSDPLFDEAFTVNAMMQEGRNLRLVANFTGLSKGTVARHMFAVNKRLQEARAEIQSEVEQRIKEIENHDATTNAEQSDPVSETTERGVDAGAGQTAVDEAS